MQRSPLAALAPLALLTFACTTLHPGSNPSTLITGALVFDGTGSPGRPASVRISGERIEAVGDLRPAAGEAVVDAHGLALAPGFIDTHSHHAGGIFEHRDALAAVSQGITTIISGQDGDSELPLAAFFSHLERQPVALNIASYVGHGSVRAKVLGEDFRRVAKPGEVAAMAELVAREMEAGALGLSTGLEYDPGIYSDRGEVLALARVAAEHGGRYISHIRSEDRTFWDAIDEILTIGRETGMPVQISHLKLAMKNLWGEATRLEKLLDEARAAGVRVTADAYPYTYWHSTLTVLFPERDFSNRAAAELVLAEIAPPEGLLLGRFAPNPSYAGKTVAEIAALRRTDPATTLMALIAESQAMADPDGEGTESVIATSMTEEDVEQLLAWPWTNICSDGALAGRHPRGFGAFTRVLGRYARERGTFPLAEAIRKMTSLAAENVGLTGRGRIAPGAAADLVLFDPATVRDTATPEAPQAVSAGIERVWVNGTAVYERGKTTGAYPGKVLRREARRQT